MTNEGLLPQNQKLTIIPSGIKRHQHDLNCEDSGCEEIINLRYKNGSWKTVGDKKAVSVNQPLNCITRYYHAEINIKHNSHLWVQYYEAFNAIKVVNIDDWSVTLLRTLIDETFVSFSSLKSILIITTDKNEYLYNWDDNADAYVELSREICPDVSFGFQLMDYITVSATDAKYATQADLFDQILIEKYKKRQQGLFSQCWVMIQWAFRLWDGSYVRHSQPVLLKLSSTEANFYHTETDLVDPTKNNYGTIMQAGIPIFYIQMPTAVRANLAKYKGLITDLCVFMSQDVSQYLFEYNALPYYEDSELRKDYAFSDNADSLHQLVNLYPYYLAKEVKFDELMDSDATTKFEIKLNESINKLNFSGDGGEGVDTVEKIPVRHNTYSWKRLGHGNWLNLLYGGFGALTKNDQWNRSSTTMEDAEQSVEATDEAGSFILQSQPELPVDDFSNHQVLCGAVPYVYNAKLHKGNTNTKFGAAPQLTDWYAYPDYTLLVANPNNWTFYREIKIVTDIGDRYVVEAFTPYIYETPDPADIDHYLLRIPPIVSYPDARATRMRIILKVSANANYYQMCSYELKSHKIYNYAYCITNETTTGDDPEYMLFDYVNRAFRAVTDFSGTICGAGGIDAIAIDDRYYLDKNRVQVSRLNNSLFYPSMYSYQIGNSAAEILAFASQSAPMSPGQFGQFPLTIFTSQGIFIMQIGGGEVIYSAVLPLNNEVALKNSICELGGAVVYASTDGVKLLSGNKIEHISREVEGEPSSKLINDNYYYNFISDVKLVNLYGSLSEEDFLDYLDENVRICYDKMNKELIVSNRDLFTSQSRNSADTYSYVYNLPYKTWHKITDTWHQFLLVDSRWLGIKNYRAGYPTGQGIYEMTLEDEDLKDCLIQSRPMKWGTYDFKKMKTIIQRSLCYVGDSIDSTPDDDCKFGLYMFASLENNVWEFVKGIKVSQTLGMIQSPSIPGDHESVRNIILMTCVNSKDLVLSHWEIMREVTMPGKLGAEARHATENLMGSYDAAAYGESYDIGGATEILP